MSVHTASRLRARQPSVATRLAVRRSQRREGAPLPPRARPARTRRVPGRRRGTSTSSACTTDAQTRTGDAAAPRRGVRCRSWTRPAPRSSARACSPLLVLAVAAWLLLKVVIGVVAGLAWLVVVGVAAHRGRLGAAHALLRRPSRHALPAHRLLLRPAGGVIGRSQGQLVPAVVPHRRRSRRSSGCWRRSCTAREHDEPRRACPRCGKVVHAPRRAVHALWHRARVPRGRDRSRNRPRCPRVTLGQPSSARRSSEKEVRA